MGEFVEKGLVRQGSYWRDGDLSALCVPLTVAIGVSERDLRDTKSGQRAVLVPCRDFESGQRLTFRLTQREPRILPHERGNVFVIIAVVILHLPCQGHAKPERLFTASHLPTE